MVPKKSKSKRKTIRQQYTARKLFFERKRKAKKQEKRARRAGKIIPKQRDPGIPNSWPFKEELLQEAQDMKEERERQKALLREQRRLQRMKEDAIERGEEVSDSEESEETDDPGFLPHGSVAAVLTHIIGNSDVILEVVDARDAINSRCLSVEKALATEMPEKVVILILNKIDLVPKEILKQTMRNLSGDIPVILWKCGREGMKKKRHAHQNREIAISRNAHNTELDCFSFGVDYLMKCLRALQKQKGEVMSVGVIGYPKVGRHSVIKAICDASSLYQVDRQNYDDLNALRRIDENIHLFVQPGEVVLRERELGVSDYLYKCYAYGYQNLKYKELCEDLLCVCPATSISYYYRTSLYDSFDVLMTNLMERNKEKKDIRPSSISKQIVYDWLTNELPHYAEPAICPLETIDRGMIKQWKEGMEYEKIAEEMINDSAIDRYCCPKLPRVIVSKNIHPTEEMLDYSCFLVDNGSDDEEEGEEGDEVEGDEEEAEEGNEEEGNMDIEEDA
ncbi:hypothetical protein WA171_001969, partial [Blastocystis sp. BT1]